MEQKLDPHEIFSSLRYRIINLSLPPESVLNLSDLADEYNVSRTPIKEVLITLQAEEWVMRHGSHFIVTPLSLERIREITEIRVIMEVQANILAMERITPMEMDQLNHIKDQISTFTEKSSNQSIVDFDFKIHQTIFKITRNTYLAKLLERLLAHYLRFWLSIPRHIDHTVFFKEAIDLIEAINIRDEARIRECTTQHIRDSVAQIMGTR